MQGKLIAGINSRVQLFKWTQSEDGSRELTNECSHVGHVLALYIVTRGDFVIVGACCTVSIKRLVCNSGTPNHFEPQDLSPLEMLSCSLSRDRL